jgi:hypothetical protein
MCSGDHFDEAIRISAGNNLYEEKVILESRAGLAAIPNPLTARINQENAARPSQSFPFNIFSNFPSIGAGKKLR